MGNKTIIFDGERRQGSHHTEDVDLHPLKRTPHRWVINMIRYLSHENWLATLNTRKAIRDQRHQDIRDSVTLSTPHKAQIDETKPLTLYPLGLPEVKVPFHKKVINLSLNVLLPCALLTAIALEATNASDLLFLSQPDEECINWHKQTISGTTTYHVDGFNFSDLFNPDATNVYIEDPNGDLVSIVCP